MAIPLPICYLNGEYLPLSEARISPLDRGFLFADSVYEVLPVFASQPYLLQAHCDRLDRSLREIHIEPPLTHGQLSAVFDELVRRNAVTTCYLYLQVTRGMEFGRNHAFPPNVHPTVFAFCAPLPELTNRQRIHGVSAITVQDFRWGRCDIKSTMLLANVLMKQSAAEAGATEAVIVDNRQVLEGSSTSVFIVRDGQVITPPNAHRILPGTTRDAALRLAQGHFATQVRPIDLDELFAADEVWLTAATRDVLPVTRIDGKPIGTGMPGPAWQKMCELFLRDHNEREPT